MESMDSRRADLPLGYRGGQAGGGRAGGSRADGSRADELSQGDVADGPRRPAELLDQLRQRLDRLPDNHPSSSREPERGREHDSQRSGDSHGAEDDPGGRDEPGDAWTDSESAGVGDELVGDARGQADGESARNGDTPTDNGDGSVSPGTGDEWWSDAGSDQVGQTRAGSTGDLFGLAGDESEAYLPWFMAPEDGVPWFASEPDR